MVDISVLLNASYKLLSISWGLVSCLGDARWEYPKFYERLLRIYIYHLCPVREVSFSGSSFKPFHAGMGK